METAFADLFSFSLWQMIALGAFIFIGGFVDSIAGGGGLITLPAYFAVGLPPHVALATNKFSSSLGTLFAVGRYLRAGKINLKVGLWATAGALGGSAAGARLALMVSSDSIRTAMLILIPAVLLFFLFKDRFFSTGVEVKKGIEWKSAAIGAVVGFYDGFFGPGTGTIMTVAFNAVLGLNLITASGNARLANLASNVGSLIVFLIGGKVLFPLALFTAAAGIGGNLLGSKLALRKGEKIVKPLLVGVLVLLLAQVIRGGG